VKQQALELPQKEENQPLPPGWRWVRLGEVCEFLDSRRIPVNQPERNRRIAGKKQSELYPYYGANGQVGWIDDYIFDEPLILLAEDGGYFGSRERPIAYAVSGRYWVNNHAHVLRPREGVDFDYCLQALRIRPDVGDLVAGSTRSKLNQETAANIPIPLPPLPEQKRIAGILTEQVAAVERARAAAQTQLEAARALPAAYLRAVFNSPEVDSWPEKPLGEIGQIGSGITLGRKLPDVETRRVSYLRVANVKDGLLDLSDVYEIEATEAEIEKLRLHFGDLLLTEGGDPDKLGRGTFWAGQLPECIHQNHIFRVRFDLDQVFPQFASYQIASQRGKAYFLTHAKRTTGIATINQTVLAGFPFKMPLFKTQKTIAANLNKMITMVEGVIAELEEQLNTINTLPAALLRRAFNGEL
jgi:type I restriction enzyme S subunit